MKQTSLEAHKKSYEFQQTHEKVILNALTTRMSALDISKETGLDKTSVSRRMAKLERLGKVNAVGAETQYNHITGRHASFTIYEKI